MLGQLGLNLNYQAVIFNCALYAMLAVGLNIAVGWAGLLDLGYIAFFGFGAYGYALFSSHAFGNLVAGTGGVDAAGDRERPDRRRSPAACSAC